MRGGEKAYDCNGAINLKQIISLIAYSQHPYEGAAQMKLSLEQAGSRCIFTGYGEGYVAVNGVRHDSPVVVAVDTVQAWDVAAFDDLAARHLENLLALSPEIVLLGTGLRQRFPAPALVQPLAAARVGFEVMDTRAACRTFNVLSSEGRRVLAAVFVE